MTLLQARVILARCLTGAYSGAAMATGGERGVAPVTALVGALLMGALVCTSSACPHRATFPALRSLTDAQATARVHAAAARRQRMGGTVKAKLPGLQGVVMSADLDVALEPPARLSVAVRSFFEQPMQVLVTDGSVVTIFDASKGEAVFLRGPVTASALGKVLPIPLWPHEVVQVFLAHPPDNARGRLVGVDEDAGTYDLWLEAFGAAPCQVTVRASDDAIVRWQHFQRDGRPLLDVRYGDLRAVGDAVMPYAWTLTVTEPRQTLLFIATDVIFNGAPLPDEAFRLEPPPGATVQPL